MKKLVAIFILFVCMAGSGYSSIVEGDEDKETGSTTATTSLKGKVVDKNTGEALTGVKLKIKGSDITTYSDFEGSFKIKGLQPGKYGIETSFISYKEKIFNGIDLHLEDENEITIELESIVE